tara:strand:+ start:274 stop:462 length:189 start_codon:yes stop_codon:yes gene_type:complete
VTARPKPGKNVRQLSEKELKNIITSRKKNLNQLEQGSISYIVAMKGILRLEKELERRKDLQS